MEDALVPRCGSPKNVGHAREGMQHPCESNNREIPRDYNWIAR